LTFILSIENIRQSRSTLIKLNIMMIEQCCICKFYQDHSCIL